MRRLIRLSVTFIIFSHFASTRSYGQSTLADEQPILSFVQITDAHVFDDGWERPLDARFNDTSEDWSSLGWAIGEINELIRTEGNIDFVVYTGDLGLQNVELDNDCRVVPVKVYTQGLPPISKEWAVKTIAGEINASAVSTFYFVPGNNDLVNEAVTEAPRHSCFVKLLQSELAALSPPSPVHVEELKIGKAVSIKGIRLAGLNTASFKQLTNYTHDCPGAGEGCPDWEIGALQKLVSERSSEPILLFTHVPDLKDPFREKPTWDISQGVRRTWENLACDSKVMAIFAGHFHDSNRSLYGTTVGTRNLTISECVAQKTWVAPPLAIKKQNDSRPGARGLLFVKLFKGGRVVAEVRWYGDSPPRHPNVICNREFWWIACVTLAVISLLVVFAILIKRTSSRSSDMEHSSGEASPSKTADWTMSQEREFIESLVGQRFNFFIVFFSIVISGSVGARTQVSLQIILTVGMSVCWMIAYTLIAAHIKLNHILGCLASDHPFGLIDKKVGGLSGRNWIGYWVPIFCSSVLTLGALLSWCNCLTV